MTKQLAIIITSTYPLNAFLRPHLEHLRHDFEITVYVNTCDMGVAPDVPSEVHVVHLNVKRNISPLTDLAALFRLWRILRRERFDLVFSMNPKSGVLAMIAAVLARVPRRVHCFTGQVWATRRGVARRLLKAMDRLIAVCANQLLADSPSQRDFLVAEGVVRPDRIRVLADGSIAGVDVRRFCANPAKRAAVRSALGIPEQALVLLYVGRLKREKGVVDLLTAFSRLKERRPELRLMLVGPDDENLEEMCRSTPGVSRVGYTSAVEEYMAAADIYCLPSYREGFGLVLVEAGAVGLPVVASRIYGITDAVVDGETGLLHEPGNIADLVDKLDTLADDPQLRARLGNNGRQRVVQLFPTERLTTAMGEMLSGLIGTPPASSRHPRGA